MKFRTSKRRLRLVGLLLFGLGTAAAQMVAPALPSTSLTAPALPTAQTVFEQGAAFLKTFYFGFSPVNLEEQISTYRLRLNEACASQYAACPLDTGEKVLKDLYRSIGDRHLYALNAAEFARLAARYEAAPEKVSTYGLTLGQTGTRGTLVLDVLSGSAAEQAGIFPGDLLTLPGDRSLPFDLESQSNLSVIVKHGQQERAATLTRSEVYPAALPVLYTPPQAPAGVRVLRIPSFAYTERVGPKVHELVKRAQQEGVSALIVDLRRGPGGSNYECEMAAAAFTGPFEYLDETPRGNFKGGWLGKISLDVAERAFFDVSAPITQGHLAYALNDPALWTGKTVVLVDSRSASCHEYMAYFMQRKGIPVLGEQTFGLMNTASLLLPLPGGGAAALPAVRTAHPDGTIYPTSLTPDVPVSPNWAGMADGLPDPMLQKAYEVLQQR